MSNKPTGVLLLAFGGPDSPEAIEPFMQNLMGGRVPPPALVEKIKGRYQLIGGKSPLPETTALQAKTLEKHLSTGQGNYKVEVGMRFWNPFISEGFAKLMDYGVDSVIAVTLAPFYSQVSTGSYMEELRRVASTFNLAPKIIETDPVYSNQTFIKAVAQKVAEGLAEFPESNRKNVQVIFSAHSLPVSYSEKGDPYVRQFELTVKQVAEKLNLDNWHLAYQSKGGGQGEWLGPMVEDVMDKIKKQGFDDVLVVPVGFVSDHIETLYDIDIAQKSYAADLGLKFYRSASLNNSELFIQALAEVVLGSCE